jgi:hypothetical protein
MAISIVKDGRSNKEAIIMIDAFINQLVAQ